MAVSLDEVISIDVDIMIYTLGRVLDKCADEHDCCENCNRVKDCQVLWDACVDASMKGFGNDELVHYAEQFMALGSDTLVAG